MLSENHTTRPSDRYEIQILNILILVIVVTTSTFVDYDLVENDSRLSFFKYISEVELIDRRIFNVDYSSNLI